ncbi:MAG TPA: AzlD domain-containing protein [Methylomirabilota bacterium]|nr:AzlD domain-containing protein [Methylomirabilota bacterium]
MPERDVLLVVLTVGAASVLMRVGGFLAAGALPSRGALPRLLRLAPGNLFIAFAAAGVLEAGWPALAGCVAAVVAMARTDHEWAALGAGFAVTALAAALG